jgi:hypothetical protein
LEKIKSEEKWYFFHDSEKASSGKKGLKKEEK